MQRVPKQFAVLLVDAVCGFVQHQDVGAHRQQAGEADQTLLATRKAMADPFGKVSDAEFLQRIPRALLSLALGAAGVQWPEGDVLDDARTEELVVAVLEQKADPGPEPPELALVDALGAEEADAALTGALQPDDGSQQGRLAAAIRPDDGEPLAGLERQIDIAQDGLLPA